MNYFILYFRRLALLCIRFYQKTVSLDHGPLRILFPYGYCRFHPTCSEYAYQAVSRYGIIRGSWLGLRRILRCNPWNKGGEDPLI